ncbi:uroporphyrinogen-III synthase [Haloactinospora alba]|uniref:uroporphyrinogen-III synthase n=1 Tax=Haloactinospora alba TaxID=405555 RepID=UPI0014777927|nr:uroporphyrinogen-III synthase [Haloactinospora alba]
MSATAPETPLAGSTIGVTAARRVEEQATMLRRYGALVRCAPTMRTVPLSDDHRLVDASHELLEHPVDVIVVTTGAGLTGWVQAAQEWGIGAPLVQAMATARIVVRGPKAKGAVRSVDLTEEWTAPNETSDEMLDYLLGEFPAGLRIAVQVHGDPMTDFCAALRTAGATVIEVPVYRWTEPEDVGAVDDLVTAVVRRELEAVTFTSAPAVSGLFRRAEALGAEDEMVAAFSDRVLAMSVGPVTAHPLMSRDVPTLWPQRNRTGAMVRKLAETLADRSG